MESDGQGASRPDAQRGLSECDALVASGDASLARSAGRRLEAKYAREPRVLSRIARMYLELGLAEEAGRVLKGIDQALDMPSEASAVEVRDEELQSLADDDAWDVGEPPSSPSVPDEPREEEREEDSFDEDEAPSAPTISMKCCTRSL